jgi:acetoin utilization deacetylase AcuC-like enzyme
MTSIIHHDDCLKHDPGPHSPESAQRIAAVLGGLEGLGGLEYLPAPKASGEQLLRVHPEQYQDLLRETEPEEGRVAITEADNIMSHGTLDAALRASGAICFAVEQVLAGQADNAFCAVRPPGHHAEQALAMGYCFFNHVAVGARHAQAIGAAKVAIVDFDVHHGNGTQAIFEDDPSVLFVSSHQMPLYPGSGYADEIGCGNIINLPLAPGAGSAEFRKAWSTLGLPAVHGFEPDLILVSAGFDAHQRDPLGHLQVQDQDYGWITDELIGLAQDSAGGRLVSILEGGYDMEALASASRAHVERLLNGA